MAAALPQGEHGAMNIATACRPPLPTRPAPAPHRVQDAWPVAQVLVLHPMPLLASGIAAALGPRCTLLPPDAVPWLPTCPNGEAPLCITDHARGLAMAQAAHGAPPPILVLQPGTRPWGVRLALQAGVLGYVDADCSLQLLREAAASVQAGRRYLCPVACAGMADSVVDTPLTPREMDVLQLLGRGLDNKTISLQLDIAVGTVKSHVKAVLDKLGASSRTQAVAVGQSRGLVVADAGPAAGAPRYAADRSQRQSVRSLQALQRPAPAQGRSRA